MVNLKVSFLNIDTVRLATFEVTKFLKGTIEQEKILNSSHVRLICGLQGITLSMTKSWTRLGSSTMMGCMYSFARHAKLICSKICIVHAPGHLHEYNLTQDNLKELKQWCMLNHFQDTVLTINLSLPGSPSMQEIPYSADGFCMHHIAGLYVCYCEC